MYEFGCYDEVVKIAGYKAQLIRKQCVFPKTKTFNNKPFYSNEKLYYIDLNGAYMSSVTSIPTGLPNENLDFDGQNTKIKDLIEILYNKRNEAKKNGNNKLALTLKFIMTSCWGYSIQRPKIIKHKFAKDVRKYVDTFAPYILRYSFNEDNTSGFVDTINSFVQHYTTPQFARNVLRKFNDKMNEIKSLVNVYYENIDAVLINESDYNKLKSLGYFGNELGKFKIEHVFTEIAIKSSKTYVATLDNGDKFYHCVNKDIEGFARDPLDLYDNFVNEVKLLI